MYMNLCMDTFIMFTCMEIISYSLVQNRHTHVLVVKMVVIINLHAILYKKMSCCLRQLVIISLYIVITIEVLK